MAHQKSYLFIPDDPRLRTFAHQIAEQRRHSLRRRDDDGRGADRGDELDEVATPVSEDGQLSLFSALSAVPIGDGHQVEHAPEAGVGLGEVVFDEPEPDDDLLVSLSPPPRGGVADRFGATALLSAPTQTRRQHKAALRAANADLARSIARRSGLSHAQVNAELNRLSGLHRVSEATVEQLDRRRHQGERWLDRL
jgi:hypothetical protein